jgi:hypothetical protein
MTTPNVEPLETRRAAELDRQPPDHQWLIRELWGRTSVGIVGGAPKCCKSWLGLDMATSVASATPCLDHFPVEAPGPVLVYLAEDALPMVRARIEALCDHRGLDLGPLPLHVIAVPVLRLDLERDQRRLALTIERLRPRLLLLDPLVRLHRLDENSAGEISGLLGYLRELQRRFDLAVVLVHHASKKHRAHPGQALRGSGDLHAFGDDNAYLARRDDHLVLTIEHRAARAPDPLPLQLVSQPDGSATHLALLAPPNLAASRTASLADTVIETLTRAGEPLQRGVLRERLRVNNQRLGDVLQELERAGRIRRSTAGWLCQTPQPSGNKQLALLDREPVPVSAA